MAAARTGGLDIIAEVAQGYEGKQALAKLLVAAAARAGADGVKFQLVYADELATPDYQHYRLFSTLEMPDSEWIDIRDEARKCNIALYLDVFGSRSLALAASLEVAGVKIHSTDVGNPGLLLQVTQSSVPLVLLSTAACNDEEIREALGLLENKDVVLLHGFQGYPTPVEANDILRLRWLQGICEARHNASTVLGFADHAPADDPARFLLPAAALGAGARVLEKHLTLAKAMQFEDFEAALNPDEFAEFVMRMRECVAALGVDTAQPSMHASELAYRRKTRKHVVAARDIACGERVEAEMLMLLRTSSEDVIYDARAVCGRSAATPIAQGTAVSERMLSNQ
jgi:sialic acid synthase SpsE